jgi:hypothetical protein
MCFEFCVNHNLVVFFIYAYNLLLKSFKESYNFIVGSTSIRTHMQSYVHTKFQTQLFSKEHGYSPRSTSNHVPPKAIVSEILCEHNFACEF